MVWTVLFHPRFEPEFDAFDNRVQDEILAMAMRLEELGPGMGRPHADTLKGSAHSNMKELRVNADGGVFVFAEFP